MKYKKNVLTIDSTLEDSKVQVISHNLTPPSILNSSSLLKEKKSPKRSTVILEENITKKTHSIQTIQKSITRNLPIIRKQKINPIFFSQSSNLEITVVIQKIFFKKKRYCFQVLKQFFLFPDESQSSISVVSKYDHLIFGEEIIHSLVKILQTKTLQNQIWGFINLRMFRYLKAVKRIEEKVTQIRQKVIWHQKQYSFGRIKKTSDQFISSISKQSQFSCINSNLFTENKQVQCFIQGKNEKSKKSCLSSNMVQQKVLPNVTMTSENNNKQDITRIYNRQEYEIKYGQTKYNKQDYQSKIIRIQQESDYSQRRGGQYFPLTIHTADSNARVQNQKSQQSKIKINKYNIIHYHERSKQTTKYYQKQSNKAFINCCTQYCKKCKCSKAEVYSCAQNCLKTDFRSCFRSKTNLKCDKTNQTIMTEKTKKIGQRGAQFISIDLHSQIKKQQLCQLSSRIQYLHFLRKLIKEQQEQQKI